MGRSPPNPDCGISHASSSPRPRSHVTGNHEIIETCSLLAKAYSPGQRSVRRHRRARSLLRLSARASSPGIFFRAPFVHLPFTKARKVRASHPPLVPRQRLTRRKSDDRALHSRPNWSFVSIRGMTTNCSGQAEGQAQALVYTRSHRYMRDGCFRAWAPCFDLFLFSRLPACGRKIGPRPDSDFRACLRAREHGPRTGRLCRRGARITGETGRATGPDFRGVE